METRGKTKEPNTNRPSPSPRPDDDGERGDREPDEIVSMKSSLTSTLKKLNYYHKSTRDILQAGKSDHLKRQCNLLKTKTEEAYNLIHEIQGLCIEQGQDESEIDSWSEETKAQIQPFEDGVFELNSMLHGVEQEKLEKERSEQLKLESEMKEKLRREEREAEEAKLARKEKFSLELEEKKLEIAEKKRLQTKLPDLQISKFQGNHLDWVRFWSLFETQIDQAAMKEEAKFSYLKELVAPKVRTIIDKLPPDAQGYKKAKTMLEERFGDVSEVVNAHLQQIMGLPVIHGTSKYKIHEFYDQLLSHVQALDTLGKLGQVSGNVRMVLDKLDGIRADLTRTDAGWKKWSFQDLLEAIRQWVDRNPLQINDRDGRSFPSENKRERNFNTRDHSKPRPCIYCDKADHKATDCEQVKTTEDRRKILSQKKLCFNCTGEKHRANDCRSKLSCRICQKKHHTSICDRRENNQLLTATESRQVIHPVVVVKVQGITCRALLDTGASNSYMSSTLVDMINKEPVRQESKTIEMLLQNTTRTIKVYDVEITGVNDDFKAKVEMNAVERNVLLSLPNPHYNEVIAANAHLQGIKMDDDDLKENLPVHVILGASEYALIKTQTPARVGEMGQPIAEKTKLGWVIMSPGQGNIQSTLMFARNTQDDYMQMCNLDVLGLEDKPEGDQLAVYQDFKDQLLQRTDGRYETYLPWKANHPDLPTNFAVAKARFNSLTRKLENQPEMYKAYDDVIRKQIQEGIVEIAPEKPENKEHYIPHKPVVKETAETTKLRIVYDASAKANYTSPSLNECLEIGPPLQRKILDILLRARFKPVFLAGDMKQAFLQIFIRESDRDVLRFLWIEDLETKKQVIYRFSRVLFGLAPSPFLLNGTLEQHLEKYKHVYPDCVNELKEGTYVDDINLGGSDVDETRGLKEAAIKVFSDGKFELHKWHSNASELEEPAPSDSELTYAKESLGTGQAETKLLGLTWDKGQDTLSVTFPKFNETPTKRVVLRSIAQVYNPIGIASPILLTARVIFRDICDKKVPWDNELPEDLRKRWNKWINYLPSEVGIPRSIPLKRESLTSVELHGFADASLSGCCAVVYAVVVQQEAINQSILVSKTRLSKRDLTIPRLELVACHMIVNLLDNTSKALERYPVSKICAWTDSSVCLHWIRGDGQYKQFVGNRVKKIKEKSFTWRHVPTEENPADIGSRGTTNIGEKWMRGPSWLQSPNEWPEDIVTKSTEETDAENKLVREIMKVGRERAADSIDSLIEKKQIAETARILAWVNRFIEKCKGIKANNGPLTIEEIERQQKFLIRRAQRDVRETKRFEENARSLNLQQNEDILLRN